MSAIFHTILFQPLFNALIILYEYITLKDLGFAIILLTILVRFLLYPLFYKSFRNQMIMSRIQPEMKKIQEDHKQDKEKQAQLMLELWKKHDVNPFSSFFLLLVQLPILFALYRIFLGDFSAALGVDLYTFVPNPGEINHIFVGLINLRERSIVIGAIAAGLQYIHTRYMLHGGPKKSSVSRFQKQMVFVSPIITLVFLSALPAAVGLYWATTSAFSVFQQILITKSFERNHGEHSGKDPKTA